MNAISRDAGSADQRAHAGGALRNTCPVCAALPNHRCKIDRHYVPTHPERANSTTSPESPVITMSTTAKPAATKPRATRSRAARAADVAAAQLAAAPEQTAPEQTDAQPAAAQPEPTAQPEPAAPATPKPLTASAMKARVSARLVTAIADTIAAWDDPDVPADTAAECAAQIASYFPSDAWDPRLPPPILLSFGGRRSFAVKR